MSKPLRIFEAHVVPSIDAIRAYQDWLADDRPNAMRVLEQRKGEPLPDFEEWLNQRDYPHETVLTELELTWREELTALAAFLLGLIGFALMFVGAWRVVHGWLGWF